MNELEQLIKELEKEVKLTPDDLLKNEFERGYIKGQLDLINWIKTIREKGYGYDTK